MKCRMCGGDGIIQAGAGAIRQCSLCEGMGDIYEHKRKAHESP